MEFDALWKDFLEETLPLVERVEGVLLSLERAVRGGGAPSPELVTRALGDLHTIKGNAGMMGLREASTLVHEMEDRARSLSQGDPRTLDRLLRDLDQLRGLFSPTSRPGQAAPDAAPGAEPGLASQETRRELAIRIDFHKLDQMLDAIGELLTQHNGLSDALSLARDRGGEEAWDRLEEHAERLGRLASELQGRITEARMLPLNQLFRRFHRMVRDLARQEGKQARLELRGGELEVDKTILDALSEPLLHLLRNAIGHGIEGPEQRRARQKPEEGTIRLFAQPAAGVVTLAISDDGNGLDVTKLRRRASEIGYATAGMSDEELQQLIFLPGFSTAAKISSLSGRGVGLDVVKRAIEELGGRLDVRSASGQGTAFLLTIPLSLSLIRALLVEVGQERYGIPISHVVEIVRLDGAPLERVGGRQVLRWRDELLQLTDLSALFRSPAPEDPHFCVVVRDGPQLRGLLVGRLFGQREVVVKPIDELLGRVPGISGAAVLGDGRIVPIIDLFSLGGGGRRADFSRKEAPK